MLEIVVCEDNNEHRKTIIENLNLICRENKINAHIILECASPERVTKLITTDSPNVFFLDIDLNAELNGLELASMIHEKIEDAYIVFLSQHVNLVFQSFKVRPFDFLPKPVTKRELSDVLLEINSDNSSKHTKEKPGFLNIKIGSRIYIIPQNEIIYIEKFGNKCSIHAKTKTVHCYQSLDSICDRLGNTAFIRCHKSYIVNQNCIKHIDLANMEILLTDGQKCYVGGKYKKSVINQLRIRHEEGSECTR